MPSAMDVLPVLTSRFLEYQNEKEGEQRDLQTHRTDSVPDLTQLYWTESWSKLQYQNHSHITGFENAFIPVAPSVNENTGNVVQPSAACPILGQTNDEIAMMWISPESDKSTSMLLSSSPIASELSMLPNIPCLWSDTVENCDNPSSDVNVVVAAEEADVTSRDEISQQPKCSSIGMALRPPETIHVVYCTEMGSFVDDEVSLLADNPDDDDVDVLPHATYDALANIFDEIYKDDSAVIEE